MSNSNTHNKNPSATNTSMASKKRGVTTNPSIGLEPANSKKRLLNDHTAQEVEQPVIIKTEKGAHVKSQANKPEPVKEQKTENTAAEAEQTAVIVHERKPLAIKDLQLYLPEKSFFIEGRISHISAIKKIQVRRRPEPKDFFFALVIDENGDSVKINFWDKEARCYSVGLKVGGYYKISKMRVYEPKAAFAIYGKLELTATDETVITAIKNDDASKTFILPQKWKLVSSIESISNKAVHEVVDVIGLVASISAAKEVTTSRKQQRLVRNFELADETAKISVTLWAEAARMELKEGQLIGIKGAKITDFAQKSLSVVGFVELKPEHSRVDELSEWKASQTAVLGSIFKKLKSISNAEETSTKHDYSQTELLSVQDVSTVQERYRLTQEMPTKARFKVNAVIKSIGSNMFFAKTGGVIAWCLKFRLETEAEGAGDWFRAVAFDEVSQKIIGISATEAQALQQKDVTQFAQMMKDIHEKQRVKTFLVRAKPNSYWSATQKRLDFVVEGMEEKK